MGWSRCPRCGFTQVASDTCLRCGESLPKPVAKPRRLAGSGVTAAVAWPLRLSPLQVGAAGGGLLLLLVGLTLWLRRPAGRSAEEAPTAAASGPTALTLAGRWYGQVSDTVPSAPSRPVLKEATIESDRDGLIVAARVVLTDPGRGGAGAGYRIAPDGPRRIADAVSALSASPGGAPVDIDFLALAPWVPTRARLWRALEGINRKEPEVRYLLLESIEDDYVVQAGINRSGFLSYAFFSPEYASGSGRGVDALSGVIHPEPGSSLRDFRNLLWDLSGSADFLTLNVRATLTGPDGMTDRMVLKR
jgi:hypothetical protein